MTNLLLVLLLSQHNWFIVHSWIVSNETYEDNEIISFDDDDDTHKIDNQDEKQTEIEYNIEEPPEEQELERKSRLLDFDENYIEPNIKHNLKLYEEFDGQKKLKRDAPELNSDEHELRYKTEKVTTETYDYDKFKNEYDQLVEELKQFQAKLNESDFLLPPKSECNFEEILNFGPLTMYCLIGELCAGPTLQIRKQAKEGIKRLVFIWGVFFGLFFLIGWAHFGYCNWWCVSKHCFPEDGYEEIKQYLVLDPPGTRTTKIVTKTNDDMHTVIEKDYYEPTETEYYLYNSLWQDIYRE